MDVTKQINDYIKKEGKGSTRDALIVAISRADFVKGEMLSLADTLTKHATDDNWCGFCAEQLKRIARSLD